MKKIPFLALALLTLGLEVHAKTPDPELRPEEEADFVGSGDFMCQEALGLRFLLPPPGFKPNQEAQANLVKTLREPGPSAYGWVFMNEEKAQLITVELVKGPRTAEDFLFFAGKVEEGFGKATGFKVEKREADTAKQPFRFRLNAWLASDNAFDITCVSTPAYHLDPAVACMITFAANHEALEKVRESLAFGGCK